MAKLQIGKRKKKKIADSTYIQPEKVVITSQPAPNKIEYKKKERRFTPT